MIKNDENNNNGMNSEEKLYLENLLKEEREYTDARIEKIETKIENYQTKTENKIDAHQIKLENLLAEERKCTNTKIEKIEGSIKEYQTKTEAAIKEGRDFTYNYVRDNINGLKWYLGGIGVAVLTVAIALYSNYKASNQNNANQNQLEKSYNSQEVNKTDKNTTRMK